MSTKSKIFESKHDKDVECVLVRSNYIITSGLDGTVRFWSLSNGIELKKLNHEKHCENFDVDKTGQYIAISHGNYIDIRTLDKEKLYSCQLVKQFRFENWVNDLRFSPDGSKVIAGVRSGEIFLLEF